MIKKAVILCGGLATRFLPYSKAVPKEMLPILDKPIIHYLIKELSENGIKDILIITNRGKEAIENYFDKSIEVEARLKESGKTEMLEELDKISKLANIHFIRQIEPKGTGHALLKAKNFIGNDPFYMCFGDEIFYNPKFPLVSQMLKCYEENGVENLIATRRVPMEETYKYGIVSIDGSKESQFSNMATTPIMHKITKFVEKPRVEDAESNLSYVGPAILSSEVFEHLEKSKPTGLEIFLTDAYTALYSKNKMYALEVVCDRVDMGNPLGFVQANLFFAMQNKEYKEKIIDYLKTLIWFWVFFENIKISSNILTFWKCFEISI